MNTNWTAEFFRFIEMPKSRLWYATASDWNKSWFDLMIPLVVRVKLNERQNYKLAKKYEAADNLKSELLDIFTVASFKETKSELIIGMRHPIYRARIVDFYIPYDDNKLDWRNIYALKYVFPEWMENTHSSDLHYEEEAKFHGIIDHW